MGWKKIDNNTYQYDAEGVRFFLVIGKEKLLLSQPNYLDKQSVFTI